jgi:hypothetical protein
MKIHSSNIDTLPQGIPEVETYRAMAKAFPSEGTSADLVVKAGSARVASAAGSSARSYAVPVWRWASPGWSWSPSRSRRSA